MIPVYAMLAGALTSNPIVYFVIVGCLIALALYYLPKLIPMDAQVWQIIRVVVIIALILWALRLFSVI